MVILMNGLDLMNKDLQKHLLENQFVVVVIRAAQNVLVMDSMRVFASNVQVTNVENNVKMNVLRIIMLIKRQEHVINVMMNVKSVMVPVLVIVIIARTSKYSVMISNLNNIPIQHYSIVHQFVHQNTNTKYLQKTVTSKHVHIVQHPHQNLHGSVLPLVFHIYLLLHLFSYHWYYCSLFC